MLRAYSKSWQHFALCFQIKYNVQDMCFFFYQFDLLDANLPSSTKKIRFRIWIWINNNLHVELWVPWIMQALNSTAFKQSLGMNEYKNYVCIYIPISYSSLNLC